ncbi:MAG TPA: PASTA domain-containing protein [Gemmataceae bacterium]|jgi:beta-lactam-binding protein with PASTA domain|nr:PASTA domain-containing protein [Gemmataceae bacterium]
MKSKLDSVIAYLAGSEGAEADVIRNEMASPASEASNFLAASQELSSDMFGEHVLKWLGLPPSSSETAPDQAYQQRGNSLSQKIIRALPWAISISACIVALLLWLDCRRHRKHLEAALDAAQAGPHSVAGAVAQIDHKPKELRTKDDEIRKPASGTSSVNLPINSEPKRDEVSGQDAEDSSKKKSSKPPTDASISGDPAAPMAPLKQPVPEIAPLPKGPIGDTEKPVQVAVPQVVGLSFDEAKKSVEAAGLVLKSADFPIGSLVVGQLPSAGAMMTRGGTVVVSFGPTAVSPVLRALVPDICGVVGADKASARLRQAGLELAAYNMIDGRRTLVLPKNYNQLAQCKVMQQTPPAKSSVAPGTVIECTFEPLRKSPPAQVTVPNVAGKAQADAERALADAGLTMKALNAAPNGRAVAQNPAAGMPAKPGDCVTVDFGAKKPSGK